MQVRRVRGSVTGGSNKAEYKALLHAYSVENRFRVPVHVRVIVDVAAIDIGKVNRVSAGCILGDAHDFSVHRRKDRSPARREYVRCAMGSSAVPAFIE